MLSATQAQKRELGWSIFYKKGCEDFGAGGCCNAILLFETCVLKIFFGPSYPPSRASLSSIAMWGTAFIIEWLSPGHYL